MPETVCVTVEQLRRIEVQCDDVGRLNWCPACEKFGVRRHEPDCWLANAIAQAERLEDWKPEVGDRVRLKANPELVWKVMIVDGGAAMLHTISDRYSASIWRDLAELMPEEGE